MADTSSHSLPALAAADHSRFVQRVRRRWPAELALLPPGAPGFDEITALVQRLRAGGRDLPSALRVARHLVLERLAVLDVEQAAPLDTVTGAMSDLAEATLELALAQAEAEADERHGPPLDEAGQRVQMWIVGMGKLGARELNVSSDIDLIYVYEDDGQTTGARPVSFHEYFAFVAKRLYALIGETTDDGIVFRVDLALRPNGNSGPPVVSMGMLEEYLQVQGREWERFAWLKSRVVAPRVAVTSGRALALRSLATAFVYRRYLDYGVFEGLRQLHRKIRDEAQRRAAGRPERANDVKLSRGGIREIEFIVQAFQLLRGGSTQRLQTRSLLEALPQLAGQKLLPSATVDELLAAYRFLRRVENRLQEWNDEQTHELPVDDHARARLALAMGLPGWPELERELEHHRGRVSAHFQRAVFAPGAATADDEASAGLEHILDPELDEARRRERLAVLRAPALIEPFLRQLDQLREGGYYRRLDETGRRRLQVLLPRLLRAVARVPNAEAALSRVLHVIERIGGRTVYLALLNENAVARERLFELCAHSQFLSDQIAAFPLLLDELLDDRLFDTTPTRAELAVELRNRMANCAVDDTEQQVEALRQFQRAAMFRIAVPDLTGRLPLMKVSDRLTDLAELLVQETLNLAWQQIVARHGVPLCGPTDDALRQAGMIVVAYGKFGGIELGYGSDLDLVFLHDSSGEVQHTAGPHAVDNGVFFLRLVQRLVHLLTVHSAAGRLYEVDTRLRPSGKGGLLVQSIEGFADYQRTDAWTWEHQALLRSRAVAGGADLRNRYESLRVELLRTSVRRQTLREDVRSMRERMRSELSKSKVDE